MEGRSVFGSVKGALIKAAFVMGSAAIVLDSVRNSMTWYLDKFWGGAGNTWQSMWNVVISHTGAGTFTHVAVVPYFLSILVFYGVGSIYAFMDLTGKPRWARKYKIQPGTNEPVEMDKFLKLIRQITFNMTVVNAVAMVAVYYVFEWRRSNFRPLLAPDWDVRVLPEFHWVMLELMVCVLVEEVAFYYSHRLFHHKSIYKFIHKRHHEYTSPVGWTAVYAHPIEHVLANLTPVSLGIIICGSHPATGCLWLTLAITNSMNSHSGYHFPFFPSPEAHDFHHLKFNQCYGVLGILDYLHGTDTLFRDSKKYERHLMSTSLVPLREMFPDDGEQAGCAKHE